MKEYADPLSRRAARQLAEAAVVRLDASCQMPPPVAEAFREGVCEYVENPTRLGAILAAVERVAQRAYREAGEDGRALAR
jgi:FixJ family two-component response regulator